jgi:tetratricopeptide (TPR) repeat protein
LPYATDAGTRAALAHAVLHETPERAARALTRPGIDAAQIAAARGTGVAALQRDLDREFEQILGIALAKEADQRYASVDAFAADLRAWIDRRPLLSRPAPRLRRAAQFVRRHRFGVAASLLLGTTAAAGIAATLWQARLAVRHAQTERAVREFTTGVFAAIDPAQARGREVPLREVLDVGARQAEKGLKEQPSVRGALLSDLGAIYTSLGDTKRGIALLGVARESLAAAPERDRDELAHAWLRLAEAQYELSDYASAGESVDAALALLADRPVTDSLRVEGEILHARIDEDADHLDEAARRIEAMVAALRADFRTAPSRMADALSALGNLRRLQARYEDAVTAHAEALDLSRRADPDDPMIASRLHELASVEQQTDKAQAGIAHLREAYALHQKVHGMRHPFTLSTEGELAQALANSAQLDEAESLFTRNIEGRRTVYGAVHSEVGKPLNNYGLALFLQHRYAEAVPLFEQACAIWRQTLGEEHINTRTACANLGGALIETGDYARAEPLLVQSVAQTQKLDPLRLQSSKFNSYGILLEKTGRLAEAERVLRGGLQIAIDSNNARETLYPWSRTLLGRVLRESDKLPEAREQLEKALAAYDADDLPDGPKTATCLFQLALVRNAQHEPAAAIKPLLERALTVQEAKLGKEHAETVATRRLLASLAG